MCFEVGRASLIPTPTPFPLTPLRPHSPQIRDSWDDVTRFDANATFPETSQDAFESIMSNLKTAAAAAPEESKESAGSKLKSAPMFAEMAKGIEADGAKFVKKVRLHSSPHGKK